jgi:hypothetical protein
MFSPKNGQKSFLYLFDVTLARSEVIVAAVDFIINYIYKFLKRLNIVNITNSIYSFARIKFSRSRR